jgi:hypothetical protein
VSTATVSYVLNKSEGRRISPRTTEAVYRAAEQLGYRPNAAARNLASGKSGVVLYVVPRVAVGEMPMQAGSRMTTELARLGLLQVQIFETEDDQHVIDAVKNLDPVAVTSLFPLSSDARSAVDSANVHYIEIGTLPALGDPHLSVGAIRVEHLISRGHRKIAFAYTGIAKWRALGDYWLEGVVRAARAHGLPPITVDDVTVDNAADAVRRWVADGVTAITMAAFGTFVHSGQACVCGSRIFAQREVYEQVVEGIANIANHLQLGGPKDEGSMIGPLISQKQLTRVLGYLDQGKSDGNELVTGGHRLDRKGYFVHPTVVTNVDPATSRLFQEEIFGPVVTILPFDDEDEAVALANDTTYGLAATAWTSNLARAHRIAKRLKAGTVGLNCQLQFDHSMPFGGYKQSGWGYESGKAGLDTYLQTKIVWAQM